MTRSKFWQLSCWNHDSFFCYGIDPHTLFSKENLKFSKDGVCEVLRNVILPLWNAYSFFVTYANIDSAEAKLIEESPRNPLDRWILSEAERMNASVIDNMEKYELSKACEPILKFLDLLNNWYIRRSRRRFWKSENDRDKEQAYDTLYTVLMKLIKTAAPFIPFVTEAIYRNLRTDSMPESVHLCDYPEPDKNRRDPALEQKMEVTRHAVVMVAGTYAKFASGSHYGACHAAIGAAAVRAGLLHSRCTGAARPLGTAHAISRLGTFNIYVSRLGGGIHHLLSALCRAASSGGF